MPATGALSWIDHRLWQWAEWSRGDSWLGFDTVTSFAKDLTEPESPYIVMSPEIEVTDRAVARVKQSHRGKWRVIRAYYLNGQNTKEIGARWGRHPDVVKRWLWGAQTAVGIEIENLEAGGTIVPG